MRRRLVAGLGAIAAIATLIAVVGPAAAARELAGLPPRRAARVLCVGAAPMVVWGVSLHLASRGLDTTQSFARSLAGFAATSFCNVVTPFGQAGGDPPAAVVVGRGFGTAFETALAAVGGVNLVNRLAAVALGIAALFAAGGVVPTPLGGRVELLFAFALVGVLAAVAWRARRPFARGTASVGARVLAPFGRLPRIDPPGSDELTRRADRLVAALDRLAADPLRLTALFGLGLVGHLLVAGVLWVALAAVTTPPAIAVVVVAVPAAKIGGLSPTPGGTGGVEAILTATLVTAGVDPAAAGVAVLLQRFAAFWLPSAVGGLAAAWLTAHPLSDSSQPARETDRARARNETDATDETPARNETDATDEIPARNETDATDETPARNERTGSDRWFDSPWSFVGLVAAAVVVATHALVHESGPPILHATRDAAAAVLVVVGAWFLVDRVARLDR